MRFGSETIAEHNANYCTLKECEICGGEGEICEAYNIYTGDILRVTREQYDILPKNEAECEQRDIELCQGEVYTCPECDGEGLVGDNHIYCYEGDATYTYDELYKKYDPDYSMDYDAENYDACEE